MNQSSNDFPNEQVIPDVDMSDESSIHLPVPSNQGSNIT
jgi:hypothetical protein